MAGELHSLNKSKNFFLLSPNHINNVLEEGVGGGGGVAASSVLKDVQ